MLYRRSQSIVVPLLISVAIHGLLITSLFMYRYRSLHNMTPMGSLLTINHQPPKTPALNTVMVDQQRVDAQLEKLRQEAAEQAALQHQRHAWQQESQVQTNRIKHLKHKLRQMQAEMHRTRNEKAHAAKALTTVKRQLLQLERAHQRDQQKLAEKRTPKVMTAHHAVAHQPVAHHAVSKIVSQSKKTTHPLTGTSATPVKQTPVEKKKSVI